MVTRPSAPAARVESPPATTAHANRFLFHLLEVQRDAILKISAMRASAEGGDAEAALRLKYVGEKKVPQLRWVLHQLHGLMRARARAVMSHSDI